ncbi:hypothetical protein ACFL6Y_11550 [Elusimicrobiota bacterium]
MPDHNKNMGPDRVIAGFAWYSEEQWRKLREVAADKDNLHDTYQEWEVNVREKLRDLEKRGVIACKVDVEIDELVLWCRQKKLKVDGSARSRFIAHKMVLCDKTGKEDRHNSG